MTKEKVSQSVLNATVLSILLLTGLIWLRSSLGKVLGGEFVASMTKAVGYFASENPYPIVKSFLQTTVIPNASLFGSLTMWGEVLVAFTIIGSAVFMLMKRKATNNTLYVLIGGLIGGIFLNVVFWISAGWTSPSTDSVNLLMLGVQAVCLVAAVKLAKRA